MNKKLIQIVNRKINFDDIYSKVRANPRIETKEITLAEAFQEIKKVGKNTEAVIDYLVNADSVPLAIEYLLKKKPEIAAKYLFALAKKELVSPKHKIFFDKLILGLNSEFYVCKKIGGLLRYAENTQFTNWISKTACYFYNLRLSNYSYHEIRRSFLDKIYFLSDNLNEKQIEILKEIKIFKENKTIKIIISQHSQNKTLLAKSSNESKLSTHDRLQSILSELNKMYISKQFYLYNEEYNEKALINLIFKYFNLKENDINKNQRKIIFDLLKSGKLDLRKFNKIFYTSEYLTEINPK